MRKWIVVILFLFSFSLKAQTITTIAGGGSGGDGSLATAASISDPTWLVFDQQGNYYVVEGLGYKIRKVNVSTGIITTFAGTGATTYNGDGGLADTTNITPGSAVFDSSCNYLYIPDGNNYRVRKVNIHTNIITTSAGNGLAGFGGNGEPATSASLQPNDVCFDKFGNTFIIDIGNYRIRKINSSGIISTYAGNGVSGYNADSGLATSVELGLPRGITTDNLGNLYIADEGSLDNCIWKVSTDGIITTFAGNHTIYAYNGDNIPATMAAISPVRVAFHSGNFYIADFYNNRIRMVDAMGIIHTVAGNGISGFSGDGGSADSAELNGPSGIAFDSCGNLYITQVNDGRIRKVSLNPGCLSESVQNITSTNLVDVYPNPVNDILHLDGITTQSQYNILSIIGIEVQQGSLKAGSNSVPIQSLPIGIYMVEVTNNEGRKTVTKIIKQ